MTTRNKSIACGVGAITPVPTAASEPKPFVCTLNGIQYVLPVDGSATILNFVPDNTTFNDSGVASWMPCVSLGFLHDAENSQWIQTPATRNSGDTIAADTFRPTNFRTVNFPYLWDPVNVTWRRWAGRTTDQESVGTDTDAVNIGAAAFNYMIARNFLGTGVFTRMASQGLTMAREVTQSLQTVAAVDKSAHDAPAVDTAASVVVTEPNGFSLKVTGIGYSITAVAAIAAPVLIELREDAGGANNLLWSTQELLPVGTSKTIMIPVNFLANVDATLTVAAPGATNFVTATLLYNDTLTATIP